MHPDDFVESHLFFVSLYSTLYFPIFSLSSVTPRPRRPTKFFLFRCTATRSPTGLLPGPTVDSDAPTFLLHAVAFANTSARGPVSRKREEERRQMLLTIRLDGGPPPIPEWIRKERIFKRCKVERRLRECSCRESVSNSLYLDRQKLCSEKIGIKEIPSLNINFHKIIRR